MMSAELLVELFCEELPPKALKRLGDAFAEGLFKALAKREVLSADSAARGFATPRRLAVSISGVKPGSESRAVEVKLMPVAVGLDAAGKPTAALLKKLEAAGLTGIDAASLKRRMDGKAEMLFADAKTPALALAQALQGALDDAIAGLPIPKVMSYQLADGKTTVQFVRPAHGLVALHGTEIVPVKALGLTAGRITHGHRFQGTRDVELDSSGAYEQKLRAEGGVIADFDARKAEIRRQLDAQASSSGSSLGPEAGVAPLLDEVTALVEMPTVYVGRFDPGFLAVPAECLVLTMRQNQKYFPLFDPAGALLPRFLIVSNMKVDDPRIIVGGNERVVRPRLEDARFFYVQDQKTRLEERVPQLAKVIYHNKLGTQLERVERVQLLAGKIARALKADPAGAERAAWLAKADLLTGMVGEFPELQGVMGRYYALHDGEPPEVADAIETHYKPRFAGDALPEGAVAASLALADRLDSLAGLFGIGQQPTGEKDPFGLRRAALGTVRILIERQLPLPLHELLTAAFAGFSGIAGFRDEQAALENFIFERSRGYFSEQGYSANEIEAVLSQRPARIHLVPRQLHAVREFNSLPEAGALAAANKRIGNILRQAGSVKADYEPALLALAEEQALARAMSSLQDHVDTAVREHDYTQALKVLASLKQPVDAFFDKVMVMDEDLRLRNNRIAFLGRLHAMMNRIADLSKLAA